MTLKRISVGGSPLIYSKELPKGTGSIWERVDLQPNERIRAIYKDGYVKIGSEKIKLTSAISPAEGFHLYDLITRNKFSKALEIGMANGMSGMYITQGLKDAKSKDPLLVSLDPFQTTQWKNVGVKNMQLAGLSKFHKLIEKKSYEAMPALLGEQFDLIFIDGMHTFDYTLVDVFYAILLCRIGGVIVIDDIKHPGPAKVVKYIDSNYSCLKRLKDIPVETVGTYVKIREDSRAWDFHENF